MKQTVRHLMELNGRKFRWDNRYILHDIHSGRLVILELAIAESFYDSQALKGIRLRCCEVSLAAAFRRSNE